MEVWLINHTPGTEDALLQHEMCKFVELLTRTGGLGSPSPTQRSPLLCLTIDFSLRFISVYHGLGDVTQYCKLEYQHTTRIHIVYMCMSEHIHTCMCEDVGMFLWRPEVNLECHSLDAAQHIFEGRIWKLAQ